MDALLMCGGRGTRLDAAVEKPLFRVCGRPMVDRVRAALRASRVDRVFAVTSPHALETRAHLDGEEPVIEAPGEGYVTDLQHALDSERVDPPVLTVAADLPLLAGDAVDHVLDANDGAAGSLAVYVPAALRRQLGVSVDSTTTAGGREAAATGINVVDADDDGESRLTHDARLAVNVNRLDDAAVAEALLPRKEPATDRPDGGDQGATDGDVHPNATDTDTNTEDADSDTDTKS